MIQVRLEHTNVTVSDPKATARWMTDVFGWRVRWEGPSTISDGYSVHVGTDESYVALYTSKGARPRAENSYHTVGGLNHIAVFTDDIDGIEARVRAAGFAPGQQSDYEPGRRFYFDDHDGIEWEVASHQP